MNPSLFPPRLLTPLPAETLQFLRCFASFELQFRMRVLHRTVHGLVTA